MHIQVWDRAVRLTHLSYPALLIGLWISAENRWMSIHVALGITLCGILIFRILWGVFGSNTARFSNFVTGPVRSVKYAIDLVSHASKTTHFGHNPLGGWSVIALLAVMSFQVVTGLFSVDTDGLFSGALAQFVSFGTGRDMSDLHELGFNLILALVCLHLVAIAFYAIAKRDALVPPMITGKRNREDLPPEAHFRSAPVAALLVCLAVAGTTAGYIAWLQFA